MMADNERLNAILCQFDIDWSSGDEARTEATNDLYFSRVSQWDDWLSEYTTLQYRGQFDVVRPVVRKLVAEMRKNPIDVLYRPKDGAKPDSADTLMGMYRTDMRHNAARSAVNVAVREQIECGVGHWRLVTEYEDDNLLSRNQVIRRRPLHESCNHVVWDCNSKEQDKSDAKHCTVIQPFSTEGWKVFAEENDIDPDIIPSFQSPDMNWMFPWISKDVVYVGEYYEVEEKNEKVFIYLDPMTGEPVSYYQRDIKDVIDDLADKGFVKVAEKKVNRRRVYKSLITCTDILKDRELIAGEHIPIVPAYGEWGFAGDKEVYEGVVRLTKDGQRLRNMIMSFNADIVARNPRKKPIFAPEQIEGYEYMYGGNDDYPYYLQNWKDENGQDMPIGPLAYMENPEVPQANAYMLEAATAAVKEVATLGVDASAANGQVAFDTVNQLNMRADLETYVFQDNLATAFRRDGEIYQSMVNDIYDVPRNVTVTLEDGSEKDVQVMSQIVDLQSGNVVTLNDIRGRYECYTDTGPSFQSMKEQNRAEIQELLAKVPPGTPEWQMLLLQYFTLLDGKGVEMMREYANKQLVMMGLKKPETPEEIQMVEQAQQKKQEPNPEMVAAMAQDKLATAELQKASNEQTAIQVKAYQAQTDAQVAAAKVVQLLASADSQQKEDVREALKLLSQFQKQNNDDARADAELVLKGTGQQHQRNMDIANILQSQRQNTPSGSVAENPQ
jgi:hypothetical protein